MTLIQINGNEWIDPEQVAYARKVEVGEGHRMELVLPGAGSFTVISISLDEWEVLHVRGLYRGLPQRPPTMAPDRIDPKITQQIVDSRGGADGPDT